MTARGIREHLRGRGVTGAVLAAAVVWCVLVAALVVIGPADASAPPACNLRRITGVPCPTCGGTRAAAAIGRGEVLEAAAHNPLLVLGGPVAAVWACISARRGAQHAGGSRRRRTHAAWALVVAAVGANWAYVIWRDARGGDQKISSPSEIHAPAASMARAV